MIVNAYSIYDLKSLVFHNPFYAPTNGAALRIVQDVANDLNTSIGRHPQDYVLYRVGSYNDADGVYQTLDIREHVIDVAALITLKPTGDLFNKEMA